MNIYNLLAAITLTIGAIILIGITIAFAISGNIKDAIAGVVCSIMVGIGAIAVWIKYAFGRE